MAVIAGVFARALLAAVVALRQLGNFADEQGETAMAKATSPNVEQMWQVLQGIAAKLGGESVAIPAAIPAPAPAPAAPRPPRQPAVLTFRVSQKGALSVYGLGRFPVTLYRNQWQSIIDALPQLRAALNSAGLKERE